MSIYDEDFTARGCGGYVKKVFKNKVRKIKSYKILKKNKIIDGYIDCGTKKIKATEAHKEPGYKLMEYYKEYMNFLNLYIDFYKYFKKNFEQIYASKPYIVKTKEKIIERVGDYEAAKEIEELWKPLGNYDYRCNGNSIKWLKEMTYDDAPMINALGSRQHKNNKQALAKAREYKAQLYAQDKKTDTTLTINDYIIGREIYTANIDNTLSNENYVKPIIGTNDDDTDDWR